MTLRGGPGERRRERERRYRRALAGGLAVSVALHILLFIGARVVAVRTSPYRLPPVETTPAPEGLVVVDVAPTDLPRQAEEPHPEPNPPRTRVEPRREARISDAAPPDTGRPPGPPGVEGPEAPPGPEAERGMSNASRLIPRYVDGRIWFDPRDPLLFGDRLARFARADSAVRAILRDWLDSLRMSDEERQRALDWTYEKDGKRWGISPEGLHLGDITIPIPFGFAPSGPRRREFEQALRDLAEIRLQNARQDAERVAKERREAMRERSEEEAERRRADTTGVRRRGGGGG